MSKYFITLYVGVGCTDYRLEEADSFEAADKLARDLCLDFASDYGYETDPDEFGGSYDTLGRNWDENSGEYEDIVDLEYTTEEYAPEEHDDYLR